MDGLRPGRRIALRLAGAALFVTTLALLVGCAMPWDRTTSSSMVSYPPPLPFIWNRVTPPPPTPQQAYAASMAVLNLCGNRPPATPATTTLTWLVAGPTYGVVLARATCSQDSDDIHESIDLLPIVLDKRVSSGCPAWGTGGGLVGAQLPADGSIGSMAYQIPSWLPLPRDAYVPEQTGSEIVPAALFLLTSSTRIFVTGRYASSATRPNGAETVSIGGRTGWQVTDHDIATVTVPLADGWTFFFSGTADGATIRNLASASLDHLDTLLPQPLPEPTDYPQPTPAC
jgi:hypothetical protein